MSQFFAFSEFLVMGACLLIPLFVAAEAARWTGRVVVAVMLALAPMGWLLLLWELSRAGLYDGMTWRTVAGLTAAAPVLVGLIALAANVGGASRVPAPDWMAIHVCRVVSLVALVALAGGALPPWIALPIGLGDAAIGATAPMAARLASSRPGWARVWHVAGAGVAGFSIAATILAGRNGAIYFLTLYPLVLLPMYLSPAALVLHAAGFNALTAPSPPESVS